MEEKIVVTLWNIIERLDNAQYVESVFINEVSQLVVVYKSGFKQIYELPFTRGSIDLSEIAAKVKADVEQFLASEFTKLQANSDQREKQLEQHIIDKLGSIKPAKDGRDADEVKIIKKLTAYTKKQITQQFKGLQQQIPIPKDGKDGKDGANGSDGRDGVDGKDGRDADEQLIENNVISSVSKVIDTELLHLKESVDTVLATVNPDELKADLDSLKADYQTRVSKIAGEITDSLEARQTALKSELSQYISAELEKLANTVKQGHDGKDADEEAITQVLEAKLWQFTKEKLMALEGRVSQEIKKRIELLPPARDGKDGKDGRDADVSKLTEHLQGYIENKLKASIFQVKEDLEAYCATLAADIQNSIVPIKGDKGDKGEKGLQGDRGNGIVNMEIDYKDHLIVTTDDLVIDAGKIKGEENFYGGGIVGFSYTNTMPMPFDIGGYEKGTRFSEVDQRVLWTKLLYGWDLPSFSEFNIEGVPQNIEVGYQITAGSYTANFTIDNPELLKEDSVTIISNGTEILANLPNSSPVVLTLPEYRLETLGSVNFQIYAYDTTGVSFLKYYVCNFKYLIYYGEYTEDIEDTGLPNPLAVLRATELTDDIKSEYLFLAVCRTCD